MEIPWYRIRIEQCNAAESIQRPFGTRSVFDYLVVENLMTFADAVEHARPEPGRLLIEDDNPKSLFAMESQEARRLAAARELLTAPALGSS